MQRRLRELELREHPHAPDALDLQMISLEPESGLEPLTYRLQGDCSTS